MLYSHIGSILFFNYEHHKYLLFIVYRSRGRIQDFKLGGGGGGGGSHLKKMRRAEGGTKIFLVFRVKNHDFTPKK